MTLRTKEQYIESLRDNREVYMDGKRVEDVTKHPTLKVCIDHNATEFELALSPEFQDIATVISPRTGERVSRLFDIPQNADDLAKRSQCLRTATKLNDGVSTVNKGLGSDALNALTIAAAETDAKRGTRYLERVNKYRAYCQDNDLAMVGAVTDVKGDRMLRAGQQSHPDYYVHIVDRRKDGIVVRGAKMHISCSSYTNEMVVCPCRAHGEEDKDYAVAFAIPCNTKGLKHINAPIGVHNSFDFPISSKHPMVESLVVFEDVFVPTERVFLCGEWEESYLAANYFGLWHRFTGLSYKQAEANMTIGAAYLAAELNGVEKASHVREELLEIVTYAQMIEALTKVAISDFVVMPPGMACPNPMITNLCKYFFASGHGKTFENLLEIAGGSVITMPGFKDYENPMLKAEMNKYLGGKKGTSAENRIRLMKFIMDFAASEHAGHWNVVTLHAEGSMAAQKMSMMRAFDPEPYKALVRKVAQIKD